MYKIEYKNTANKDIKEILSYISHILYNKTSALKLKKQIMKSEKVLSIFPYANKCYFNNSIKHEYYKYKVKNYYLFYTIDEQNKIITIVRVLYRKRNFENILK